MAQILDTNSYELSQSRLDDLEERNRQRIKQQHNKIKSSRGRSRSHSTDFTKINEGFNILLEKERKKLDRLKKFQDDNVVMGGLHRIKYRFFKHDSEPLALFFNETKTIGGVKMIPAINLHYLIAREGLRTLELIRGFNAPRMGRGFPPAVIWPMIERLPWALIPYRLYRLSGIRPLEYIPLASWDFTVNNEKSRWQGFRDF